MRTEYIIITEQYLHLLEKRVNEKCKLNFVPQGGITMGKNSLDCTIYIQAMTRVKFE